MQMLIIKIYFVQNIHVQFLHAYVFANLSPSYAYQTFSIHFRVNQFCTGAVEVHDWAAKGTT